MWRLKEVIDKGKAALDWDLKWHAPGAKRLANGRMHGLGFMSINQWEWIQRPAFASAWRPR